MPQPYLRTKIYNIYKPSLGLIKNEPTSILNPRASIDCQDVRFYDGKVEKKLGYDNYITPVYGFSGIPLGIYNFNGTIIYATTSNVYWLDGATWTSITGSVASNLNDRITLNRVYDGSSDSFYLVYGSKNTICKKWKSGSSASNIADGTSTWKPKVIVPYQFRLLMFNIKVGDTNKPIRMSYCAANDITTWGSDGAADRNLPQGEGKEIMNALPMKNWLGIYKDKSITLLNYVGGDSIFATQVMVDGIGLMAQDAIVNLGTKHIFLGSDYNIYQWEGGGELIPIGDPIKRDLQINLNRNYRYRCFAVHSFKNKEVNFFIPGQSESYCTIYYTYNYKYETWAKNTCGYVTSGGLVYSSDDDELSMLGTYNDTTPVDQRMYATPTENNEAITAHYITPDITCSDDEHIVINKNFKRVIVEAKGSILRFRYSTDYGESWSDYDTLDSMDNSYYKIYSFYFTTTARKIRLEFSSVTSDAYWAIRYIGIEYKERERK